MGYLLEEIVAYLLRNAGYQLLVSESQDDDTLKSRGNNLYVQGRGALHQVDALGQLALPPAFTYPIRLFVEAKCIQDPVDLPVVRNAVGVLTDVNQGDLLRSARNPERFPMARRFTYCYSIFSTSGFTDEAATFAIAHQVSLVDLSGPEFAELRNMLAKVSEVLAPHFRVPEERTFPEFRRYLRMNVLKTWPPGVNEDVDRGSHPSRPPIDPDLQEAIRELREFCIRQSELLLGVSNGPFLLILKPDRMSDFTAYARRRPTHPVTIHWSHPNSSWVIQPVQDPGAYTLTFCLPQALANWVFGDPKKAIRRAWNVKQQVFSDICVYQFRNGRDHIYRLTFDVKATAEQVTRMKEESGWSLL